MHAVLISSRIPVRFRAVGSPSNLRSSKEHPRDALNGFETKLFTCLELLVAFDLEDFVVMEKRRRATGVTKGREQESKTTKLLSKYVHSP